MRVSVSEAKGQLTELVKRTPDARTGLLKRRQQTTRV